MTVSTDQAMVTFDVAGTKIEGYGQRALVTELLNRLMKFHPQANEVGEVGMLAAAQLSVLIGASPLPGLNEIHIWRDPKSGRIVVSPGINYDRRRAAELGGFIYLFDPRPMTMAEREQWMIPASDYAAICRAARWADVDKLMAHGITFNEALNHTAIFGIGTAATSESHKKGRPLMWTAMKRCQADAARNLFPNLYQPENPTEAAERAIQQMGGIQEAAETRNIDLATMNAEIFGDDIIDSQWSVVDQDTGTKQTYDRDWASNVRSNGSRLGDLTREQLEQMRLHLDDNDLNDKYPDLARGVSILLDGDEEE